MLRHCPAFPQLSSASAPLLSFVPAYPLPLSPRNGCHCPCPACHPIFYGMSTGETHIHPCAISAGQQGLQMGEGREGNTAGLHTIHLACCGISWPAGFRLCALECVLVSCSVNQPKMEITFSVLSQGISQCCLPIVHGPNPGLPGTPTHPGYYHSLHPHTHTPAHSVAQA